MQQKTVSIQDRRENPGGRDEKLTVIKRNGEKVPFQEEKIRNSIEIAAKGHEDIVTEEAIDHLVEEVKKNVYDGIPTADIEEALIFATTSYIEKDPVYSKVSANLFRQKLYKEVIGRSLSEGGLAANYKKTFREAIRRGVDKERLDERMAEKFDIDRLAEAIEPGRDEKFEYMGIKTLYERYLLKIRDERIELPQIFWMRVAMGLALEEDQPTERAIEFYEMMSNLRFVPSTPTLFHSGTSHPQLSSCYLTTVEDDLDHIFKSYQDHAKLSKWSGGLGNDWTNLRAQGALIKSTNIESTGPIPFLKISNDVTAAINRSGKRRGAACAYLETWHLDIEDFLDLRRNTGDERRRTHDMDTSNWIPDLFMKRVMNDGKWTLFSPQEVSELHHIYGKEFEEKYKEYEEKAEKGEMEQYRQMPARKLWKTMLTRLFETGHPWITFKDPCNVRSPQDHAGTVHSSNLCTEITLNTSADETAVCNLGSVNLAKHVEGGEIQEDKIEETVETAMRMLDNVIDLNFYPTPEAENSNMRHRPVGLGVMGFQDALFQLGTRMDSEEAIELSDKLMEYVSYNAILGSSKLAKERGSYPSFEGSKWDRDMFPLDTMDKLEEERGVEIPIKREERLNWDRVREHVQEHGMRNSNTMAIAPTATISTIVGSFPSIEPPYKNMYVKSNMSGDFTIVNEYLVEDLKERGLWNEDIREKIKFYDGSIQEIDEIPDEIKEKHKTAFEIDPQHIVRLAAERGKWIDQSQSLNIFFGGTSGKQLSEIYLHAWRLGLKTTYYLRTLGASQAEKTTVDQDEHGYSQTREHKEEADSNETDDETSETTPDQLSKVEDPTCEACQ
ncbi:MAG: ribonucleoside-diphosphate reductase subunit alpha [Candidatus Nanohaloarchaea archaeon]|nr:ribonucleoside-diphosphate reductase subunit alpha [Candidatus Nanohaloarchaea archaeon]